MDVKSCDFCNDVIQPDDVPKAASLDTKLVVGVDRMTDARHFDVCLKCAPFLPSGIPGFIAAVAAARATSQTGG
jgi:hypothetical protein